MTTPSEQVTVWLDAFGAMLDAGDSTAVTALFGEECYWRDLVAFTWNVKTLEGRTAIREMLLSAVSEALVQSFVELRVLRLLNWRTLSRLTKGIEPGAESSVTKLVWSDMSQALASRALEVLGPAAPLWWDAAANPGGGTWQRQWLWSKG